MIPVLMLLGGAGVTGVVLLAMGVRGGLVSMQPHCGGCGFDLSGLAIDGAGVRCPECGADLSVEGSRRQGRRERRPRLIAAGGVLTAIVVGVVVIGLIGVARGPGANAYKPVFWLMWEVQGAPGAVADAALKEMQARLAARTLSDSQAQALVDVALLRQGDPNKRWSTAWGDFVESANSLKAIRPAQWDAYIVNAVRMAVRPRLVVRSGDRLPIEVGPVMRCGSGSGLACRAILTDLRLDGRPIGENPGTFMMDLGVAAWGGAAATVTSAPAFYHSVMPPSMETEYEYAATKYPMANAEPGERMLSVTFVLQVSPTNAAAAGGTSASSGWSNWVWGTKTPASFEWEKAQGTGEVRLKDPEGFTNRLLAGEEIASAMQATSQYSPGNSVARWKQVVTVPLTVVAAATETVEVVTGAEIDATVKGALRASAIRRETRYANSPRAVTVMPLRRPMPISIAADLFVVGPSGERRIGRYIVEDDLTYSQTWEYGVRGDEAQADGTYTVILRGSTDVARLTTKIRRIWGGTLRFEGLVLGPDPSAPAPTPTPPPPPAPTPPSTRAPAPTEGGASSPEQETPEAGMD